jgi:hypothetical protein
MLVGACLVVALVAGLAAATRHRAAPHLTVAAGDVGGGIDIGVGTPTTTEATTTTSEPTTTTTTARPTSTTIAPKYPIVIAKEKTGDLPAGTPLSGPVPVTGHVRTTAGAPVSNACITVEVVGDPHSPFLSDWRTGPDGAFAVVVPLHTEADWIYVSVRDCTGHVPGFARQRLNVLGHPTVPSDVPVTVVPGSALRGAAVHAAGGPVADACVGVSMNPITTVNVRTGADGSWLVPDLPLGRYSVALTPPGESGCGLWYGAPLAMQDGTISEPGSVTEVPLVAP